MPIFVHTTDGRTYTAVVDDQTSEDETLTSLLEQTGDFARGWIRVHDQRGHDGYVPYSAVVRVARGDEPKPPTPQEFTPAPRGAKP